MKSVDMVTDIYLTCTAGIRYKFKEEPVPGFSSDVHRSNSRSSDVSFYFK